MNNVFDGIDYNYTKTDVIPKGDYELVVADAGAERKDGKVTVKLQFQVITGQFQNRKFTQWFTIFNQDPNKQVGVNIALRSLDGICQAVGTSVTKLREGLQALLCGKPFIGSVVIRPANGSFEESNAVTKASPRTSGMPPQQPTMPPAQPTQTPQPSVNQQGTAQQTRATPWG